MQPYLFPYIGYYQLAYEVDEFIFYDDVSFIKQGYIHRNNLLAKNKSQRFTLPVLKASQNSKINELYFSQNLKKTLTSIRLAYAKAPYFNDIYPLVEAVLNDENRNVANITARSIIDVFSYLNIDKKMLFSSDIHYQRQLSATQKLIDMCKRRNAQGYCNAIGGKGLYSIDEFEQANIKLSFIQMDTIKYQQSNNTEFIGNLSILDVLMWNSKQAVIDLLMKYKII